MCDEQAGSTSPQPLDLIGVLVVLNEPGRRLYRIVSTGEILSSLLKDPTGSRVSLTVWARSSALAASRRAITSEAVSCVCLLVREPSDCRGRSGLGAGLPSVPVLRSVPYQANH